MREKVKWVQKGKSHQKIDYLRTIFVDSQEEKGKKKKKKVKRV